jgi:predicted nucleic acid-binding protein
VFDTNVILDVLLKRKPFCDDAAALLNAAEESKINGFICADCATTLYYLMRKAKNKATALENLKLLFELFEIVPLNRPVLEDALAANFADYEDSVMHQAAFSVNADGIVTRNPKDYKNSKIPIYTPQQLLAALDINK